jgi:hypothetical protein
MPEWAKEVVMERIVIVTADGEGNAPAGCKVGTIVRTLNGTYRIVSGWKAFWSRKVHYNPYNGYWSEQISIEWARR